MGEDLNNPPESAVPTLEPDRYYRWVTYLLVPILWTAFTFSAWFVTHHNLLWHVQLAMVLVTGSVGGFCINLGHELGHKNTRLERWLTKIVLAPTGYGHFVIKHNRGHHRDVATPEDPAPSGRGLLSPTACAAPGKYEVCQPHHSWNSNHTFSNWARCSICSATRTITPTR